MRTSLAWLHEAGERNDATTYQRDSGAPASIGGMYPFSIGGASKSQITNVAGIVETPNILPNLNMQIHPTLSPALIVFALKGEAQDKFQGFNLLYSIGARPGTV